eukprot:TRINITY_DN326_c0_g1_i1.p1 TRINITY_DN326_c0_g1~~TRINITY_DN326_c0_g1_i1.p1  ORF type:complete len:347 (+),score=41.07 TRINITY_DN326_c0_g1_i1:1207-2247(+)
MINDKELQKASGKKFVQELNATQKKYYSIRHAKITFQGRKSTAIILQDETSFEELKMLDQKYQRLYLASVVHDIRTPVNGILGMLEAIEQSPPGESIKNFIAVIRSSAKLLLFLTNDIIDYSQIEANTISTQAAAFDPCDVLKECMQLLEFNFTRKGVNLTRFIDYNVPKYIVSDRNRYTQILLNLLGNALKFTFHGEVNICLKYSEEKDLLITQVRDTGIGIKEEDMPKLFKLFGKIRENNEINPTGVGMGLTICKKLTELLGGTIKADSVYGLGSVFAFTISSGIGPNYESNVVSPSTLAMGIAEERINDVSLQNDSHTFFVNLNPLSHRPLLKEPEQPVSYFK